MSDSSRSRPTQSSSLPPGQVSCQHHYTCSAVPQPNRSCPHLAQLKKSKLFSNFPYIHQYLLFLKRPLLPSQKIPVPKCNDCSSVLRRMCLCAHCVYYGCWEGGHISKHFQSTDHTFGVDVASHNLFCAKCNDFVYDTDYDNVLCAQTFLLNLLEKELTQPSGRRAVLLPWRPGEKEKSVISQYSNPFTVPPHLIGLRGLINLGNTCFMNCILQSFLVIPMLRNFFLSDIHNRFACQRKRTGVCLACEMESLFEEVFSGAREPFSPSRLLYSVWKISESLSGYEQQDAHEFYISALNGVHQHSGKGFEEQDPCFCIMHRVFGGVLRSDVTCSQCNYQSSAFDPFFDISLDISRDAAATLEDRLTLFTSPERLDYGDQHQCSRCSAYQKPVKQLSIHSLPPVLCIHLKRFEQKLVATKKGKGGDKGPAKVDSVVKFPLDLDMGPYTRSSVSESGSNGQKSSYDYELFAVVSHLGGIDNGHYISYVRHPRAMWVKCDDAFITKSSCQTVLESQGYLLFYIKKYLGEASGEPNENPTADGS